MSRNEQNRVEPEHEQDLQVDVATAESVRGGADSKTTKTTQPTKPIETVSLNFGRVELDD